MATTTFIMVVGSILGLVVLGVLIYLRKDDKNYNIKVGIYRLVGKDNKQPVFAYNTLGAIIRDNENPSQGKLILQKGKQEAGTFPLEKLIPSEQGGYKIDLVEKEVGSFEVMEITVDGDKLGKNTVALGVKELLVNTIRDIHKLFEPKKNWFRENSGNIFAFLTIAICIVGLIMISDNLKTSSANYKEASKVTAAGLYVLKEQVNETKLNTVYDFIINQTIQVGTAAPGTTQNTKDKNKPLG